MKTATLPQPSHSTQRQNVQPPARYQRAQASPPASADSPNARPRSTGPTLNKVALIGTLTRDPLVKTTSKGTSVSEVSLALNRFYTSDQGERREETTYVDVELWGRQAELANEYLRKGRSVFIEGRLKLDTWEDKESGQKRSKLRVVGENLQFLGSRDGDSENSSNRLARPPQRHSANSRQREFEDDIPR